MATMIDRLKAQSIIPEETIAGIISGVRKESVAMQLFRRLPNMSTKTAKQAVLASLPHADFVNGDAGMKITTDMMWKDKQLVVGEIAAIVPIPQAVLDDAEYDIWGEVEPALIEKFSRVFDNQVFNGGNPKAPVEWPDGLIPQAVAAGNVVTIGTGIDIAEDINQLFGKLEEDEWDVTAIASQLSLKTKLRGLRDANNQFIFSPPTGDQPGNIYSVPTVFVGRNTWDKSSAIAIAGEWENAVYSIRSDITFKIFDTGSITDDDGKTVYNLLQQDMIAMRAVMRVAWQVSNPIDIDRDFETAFPFAVLKPSV